MAQGSCTLQPLPHRGRHLQRSPSLIPSPLVVWLLWGDKDSLQCNLGSLGVEGNYSMAATLLYIV